MRCLVVSASASPYVCEDTLGSLSKRNALREIPACCRFITPNSQPRHTSIRLSGSLSFAEATDPFALAPAVPTTGGGAALESNATRTERGRRVA